MCGIISIIEQLGYQDSEVLFYGKISLEMTVA